MMRLADNTLGRARGVAVTLMMATGLMVSGCVTDYNAGYSGGRVQDSGYGDDYRDDHRDGLGTIVSAREVMVRSDGRGGAILGAVAGGATGAALGGDTGGSIAGGLIGAVIGGVIGSEIDKSSGSHQAVRYVIDMDHGRTITVIEDRSRYYRPGTRVRVYFGDYVEIEPVRRRRHY